MTRVQNMLGRLQFWLQGWPMKKRPHLAVRLGNLISDIRYAIYFRWGPHDDA